MGDKRTATGHWGNEGGGTGPAFQTGSQSEHEGFGIVRLNLP